MINIETLVSELRSIYEKAPDQAPMLMEQHLEMRLSDLPPEQKCATLSAIRSHFMPGIPEQGQVHEPPLASRPVWADLAGLILGKAAVKDLNSAELSEKLAAALNTLFETINDIMAVINRTLTGQKEEFATIRQVIGRSISGENEPLEDYLYKIKEVFLVSHTAFQKTAEEEIKKLLSELDPDNIEKEQDRGLKFGPMRKAELYDMFCHRFDRCEKWFKSGRFREEFLRDFEKNCLDIMREKGLG